MLDLEVSPERALGTEHWEFVLGMPFYHAVSILQRLDRYIQGVQVWYSKEVPLRMDLVLNLSQDGIRLLFDPYSQRLKIIEVNNLNKVKLTYCGIVFSTPENPPNIDKIDQSFGATHPGNYIREKRLYILHFRGLTFDFPIDCRFEPRYAQEMGSLQFPNGASPVVGRLSIYSSNTNVNKYRVPDIPVSSLRGSCFLESLEVLRSSKNVTKGIKVALITEDNDQGKPPESRKKILEKVVCFGDHCQNVMSSLGSPNKVFYKSEDKMKIHSADKQSIRADYFYNYFTLGIDILFDAFTHRVKKFILHTNYPGDYNFNMYCRCDFKLPVVLDKRKRSSQGGQSGSLVIDAFTMWKEVQSLLIHPQQKPVVINPPSSPNTSNPFGPTFTHGVDDIIFEVMPNDHIASVTLYQRQPLSTTTHSSPFSTIPS